jgi:hypothetical protein
MKNLIRVRKILAAALAVAMAGWLVGGVPGRGAAPASGPNRPWTMESAQAVTRELALRSPNPFVRETAYHDRDADWSIDLATRTFSVKIHGPEEKVCTGKLVPTTGGRSTAVFDDEAALSRGWVVPADHKLTSEEARRCLTEMGGRHYGLELLQHMCGVLKNAVWKVDPATDEVTCSASSGRGPQTYSGRINLRERTFTLRMNQVGEWRDIQQVDYSGGFGWNKDRTWTAWPILKADRKFGTQPMIPLQDSPRD